LRIDYNGIRDAIDSRLSALDASAGRRERIRQRIHHEEGIVVRKKITTSMVLVFVALLALAGVALAAGLNLFEYFGKQDARLAEIAPAAILATESPQTVESSKLGTTVAAINSAYYDGQSLLVAYSIKNDSRTERFTPTDDQLTQMTKLDNIGGYEVTNDEEQYIMAEFIEAQKNGKPYGIVRYSVYPSDHTETDDGIDLPPAQEMQEASPEGEQYILREYENPLPEEVLNRDYLNIQIRLYQTVNYLYFDGKDCYMLPSESQYAGAMTTTVRRADAKTLLLEGEGTYNGAKVRVQADASAIHTKIIVSSDTDVFIPLDEDSWYNVIVRDAQGTPLRTSECGAIDTRTIQASLDGTGVLPNGLSVYILVASEGEWDEAAAIALTTPIQLTMEK
jgi:hypothetical protein